MALNCINEMRSRHPQIKMLIFCPFRRGLDLLEQKLDRDAKCKGSPPTCSASTANQSQRWRIAQEISKPSSVLPRGQYSWPQHPCCKKDTTLRVPTTFNFWRKLVKRERVPSSLQGVETGSDVDCLCRYPECPECDRPKKFTIRSNTMNMF